MPSWMPNWDVLAIAGIALLLMYRIDLLGKQIEAVSHLIRDELATTQERKNELMREWDERGRTPPWPVGLLWGLLIAWLLLHSR